MLDSTEADDDNFFLNNLARPTNEMQSVVDSPPSLGKGSNEDGGLLDGLRASRCGSPLLETTPMPTDDLSICPYCNKNFRKVRPTLICRPRSDPDPKKLNRAKPQPFA